jgi:tetratricopeptide (TPR) repeat protein
MKRTAVLTAALLLIAASALGDDIESSIEEAKTLAEGGDNSGAIALLEKLVADHPENSDAMAYLGLYTGMGAGQAAGYEEAGRLMMLSFERLDKAVRLDRNNPEAWLFRGIMGIKVPGFFGRLEAGIKDLERAVELYSASPDAGESMITALTMLAEGYGKNGDQAGRKKALEKILELAPGTGAAESAEAELESMGEVEEKPVIDTGIIEPKEGDSEPVLAIKKKLAADPEDPALLFELGEAYYAEESFHKAREALKNYIALDDSSAEAYRMLALATSRVGAVGYDENIYENTDYLSNVAFEAMAALDRAVELAPEDIELRLTRGVLGLQMPFFLGKHDQSVADLEMVSGSDVSDEMRAEALFYLGYARQREALRYWIKAAREYPGSDGARLALDEMRPQVARLDESELEGPHVVIDFVLGFQDELAPQTAVWIEDEDENYVATVYVSGFAGNVKEKQVTLPVWSAVSGYEGIDAVTGASIDVGHHILVWNLEDHTGEKVGRGKYRVRVETTYWPSMLYQNVSALIEVGRKGSSVRIEEGDYIPFLEVTYVK